MEPPTPFITPPNPVAPFEASLNPEVILFKAPPPKRPLLPNNFLIPDDAKSMARSTPNPSAIPLIVFTADSFSAILCNVSTKPFAPSRASLNIPEASPPANEFINSCQVFFNSAILNSIESF